MKVLYPYYVVIKMASFILAHLEPDECEYELCIRGLPSQLTRQRLTNLEDILSREALGSLRAPDKCCNKNFVDEVNQCFRKLEELEKLLVTLADYSQSNFKPHRALHSRLNHLFIRLSRIHSNDNRIIVQVNGLTGKCGKYISFLNETLEGRASLSELLKGEKLISQMSFLGISSSTEEVEPQGATALSQPVMNELSMDLSLGELSVLRRENTGSNKGPASDAGEDMSDYINVLEKDLAGLMGLPKKIVSPKLISPTPSIVTDRRGAVPKNPFYGQIPMPAPKPMPRRNVDGRRSVNFSGTPKNSDLGLSPIKNLRCAEYDRETPRRGPDPPQPAREVPRYVREPPVRQPVRDQARAAVYNNNFPEDNYPEVRRFDPRGLFNARLPRSNYRNPVPNWHLVFTGDGKGLSVNDFVTQVYYMARADRVSEEELVASAIHLFAGPARSWYMSVESSVDTWEQLCFYLYEDFTSQDGDFGLMKELEQRHQGNGEPFVVYLASMVNIFDQLMEPLSEAKKIDMVTRNMLPYLIERLALVDITSLAHLSRTCKKIEDAKSRIRGYRSAPVNEPPRREPRRQMYEVEAAPLLRAAEVDVCWNCREPGHYFKYCRQTKMRVFCFYCGELGQLARQCTTCGGAENRNGRSNHPYDRDGQRR